jgi:serine/threonine protein kinase
VEVSKKSFLTLRKDTALENPGPDGFIVESEIGKGSFGEVFKVRDKGGEGKVYAMKLLEKAKILGHNLTRYAITERNVLSYSSNHNHPYLMKLFFAFQTSQHLVLILEYCEGGSMRRLIQLAKQLEEDIVTLYSAEVLLALEFLHDRNILYRDLKPDNVVFKDRHCMLTDFGLSKESKSERSTSFCGSSAYLAPEMLKRQGHGHAVDIYGLGVLAFEMRTGSPPFYTRNKDELFKNIESANLRMPTQFSPELADFVQKVMERNVEKRLGSANTKDVRTHPLFAREGIDWDKLMLKEVEAPVWPAAAQQRPRHRPVRSSALQHRGSRRHVPGWNYVSPQLSGRPPEAPPPDQKGWSLW